MSRTFIFYGPGALEVSNRFFQLLRGSKVASEYVSGTYRLFENLSHPNRVVVAHVNQEPAVLSSLTARLRSEMSRPENQLASVKFYYAKECPQDVLEFANDIVTTRMKPDELAKLLY